MKIPRPNTTGLAFGAIYIASMAICVIKAQFIDDPKGRYIMLQLPVALQHALLWKLGVTRWLHGLPWAVIYLILGTPTLVALVYLGSAIETIFKKYSQIRMTADDFLHHYERQLHQEI